MIPVPSKAKVGKSTPTPRDGVKKPVVKISLKDDLTGEREKQPDFAVCSQLLPVINHKMSGANKIGTSYVHHYICKIIAEGKPCIDPAASETGIVGRCNSATLETPE